MDLKKAIFTILSEAEEPIQGKTRLQKIGFFIAELLKEDFGYQAYYYGPYSPQVEEAINELIGLGLVRVETYAFGGRDEWGREIIRYDFHLSRLGQDLSYNLTTKNDPDIEKVREVTKELRNRGIPSDYLTLTVAAKALYILKSKKAESPEHPEMNPDGIAQVASDFGWELNENTLKEAVDFICELGLVNKV